MESFRDLFVIIVAGIIRLVRKELRYRMRNCIPFYMTEAEIWLLHDFYILKGLSFKLNLILVSLYLAKDFIHDLAERKRAARKNRHQK
jgi:hypothetical protein